jgi:hypothetical protein
MRLTGSTCQRRSGGLKRPVLVPPWWPKHCVHRRSWGFLPDMTRGLTCRYVLRRTLRNPIQPPWQRGGQGFESPQLHPGCSCAGWGRLHRARLRRLASRSCGTATGTATRPGLLRTVAYFTGRRTPGHLHKLHAGELPWTGRSCLGVKGSQVQILSARQREAAGQGPCPERSGTAPDRFSRRRLTRETRSAGTGIKSAWPTGKSTCLRICSRRASPMW